MLSLIMPIYIHSIDRPPPLPTTFELTNLKYDFVQKIPFQVSVMVFVSSMLFPDTGGGCPRAKQSAVSRLRV